MTREEMIAEAKRLHASGFSIRQIEKEIRGPSRMTVWRWVNGAHDGPGAGSKRPSKGRPVKIPEVEGGGAGLPRHRPRRQGRAHRAPAAGERHPEGRERDFKRGEPQGDGKLSKDELDRLPEADDLPPLERTHRFLEDIEELL